jgi:hypothetical protein
MKQSKAPKRFGRAVNRTRASVGARRSLGQGRPLTCNGPLFEIAAWFEGQRSRHLDVTDEEIGLEFQERLQDHLEFMSKLQPDDWTPKLNAEKKALEQRLSALKGKNRRVAVRNLLSTIKAGSRAIQKATDMTAEEQKVAMLNYWQSFDWACGAPRLSLTTS